MSAKPKTNAAGRKMLRQHISDAELARRLSISRQAVGQWGPEIPIEWVIPVENVTGIQRETLAPQFFRPPPKETT